MHVTCAVYANDMERIQEFAERHHALIRRRDAEHLGVTKSEFDAMVRHDRLERVGHCVYRVPGSVPTWRQRLLAAVWSKGADAVASDLSAAALWRVPGFPYGPIEVCRLRHGSSHREGGVRIRETSFLPAHHRAEV